MPQRVGDVSERIDGSFLQWFEQIERMESGSNAKNVYKGGGDVVWVVARRQVHKKVDYLKRIKKKDVGQGRRMGYDKNERRGFVTRNSWGFNQGNEHLNLNRIHNCWFPQLYEGTRSVGGEVLSSRDYSLMGHGRKFLLLYFLPFHLVFFMALMN